MKIIHADTLDKSFFLPRSFKTDVATAVTDIIEHVKNDGDNALHRFCTLFDAVNPVSFHLSENTLDECRQRLQNDEPDLYKSLCLSRDLALQFAHKQRECFTDFEAELSKGLITGQKTVPVKRAGLYVPNGRFPLLSTVIMCASPAVAAGCEDIILCTPPKMHPDDIQFLQENPNQVDSYTDFKPWVDEKIIATAALCGIKNIFTVGGAQAIAAMAFGTQTIPQCDVIVGPGNKYVAEAKKQVYGTVGIDMLAGPTEVFIIADDNANPTWVAADLLAQAEHDIDAQAVLATASHDFATAVCNEVENQLKHLSTCEIAKESLKRHGMIIITENLSEAVDIANKKAPEHLELALEPGKIREEIESSLHNYGSLFVGHRAAEVLGDYSAGLNHTLPTSGSARFTGGLSVRHFLKTLTTLRTSDNETKISQGTQLSLEAALHIGNAEGLAGHAHAAKCRLNSDS